LNLDEISEDDANKPVIKEESPELAGFGSPVLPPVKVSDPVNVFDALVSPRVIVDDDE